MKIKASINSPLYEMKHFYGKPQPVKRIKEECKKNLLLAISVEETSEMTAINIQERIFKEISSLYSGTQTVKLSDCKWAEEEMKSWYDGYVYKDCLCIPKDFDNLEEQKKDLLKAARDIIRAIKKENGICEPFLRVKDEKRIRIAEP